jgi:hypothetical protein
VRSKRKRKNLTGRSRSLRLSTHKYELDQTSKDLNFDAGEINAFDLTKYFFLEHIKQDYLQ